MRCLHGTRMQHERTCYAIAMRRPCMNAVKSWKLSRTATGAQRRRESSGVPMLTVEFFGVPRQRAGCAEAGVRGETVTEILAALETSSPALRDLRRPDGGLSPHY